VNRSSVPSKRPVGGTESQGNPWQRDVTTVGTRMGQKGNGERGRNGRRPTGTRKEGALDAWSAKTTMGMGSGQTMEDHASKRGGVLKLRVL